MCGVRCAVCSVQCAVCSVQCAVCSLRCAVCGVRCMCHCNNDAPSNTAIVAAGVPGCPRSVSRFISSFFLFCYYAATNTQVPQWYKHALPRNPKTGKLIGNVKLNPAQQAAVQQSLNQDILPSRFLQARENAHNRSADNST